MASRGDSFPFGRPMRANEGSETEIIRPFTFPPHSKIRARHGLLMPLATKALLLNSPQVANWTNRRGPFENQFCDELGQQGPRHGRDRNRNRAVAVDVCKLVHFLLSV